MSGRYDIITVGGGLGGSTLAKVMAEHGAQVLVLERETQFKDRVRGELIAPWGVAETHQLGIYEFLRDTCAHEVRWFNVGVGSAPVNHRDLVATTPHHVPALTFYHAAMQEALLQAAADAGAEVQRGAVVRDVKPGVIPTVVVEHEGQVEELHARLVAGADGRTSMVRKWVGFSISHDPPRRLIAGVLVERMAALPEDTALFQINPEVGLAVAISPQGKGRARAYVMYPHETPHRLQGTEDMPRFIAESIRTGVPAKLHAGVQVAGPLASFDGADTWVEHPYKGGVALIGDAAATSDPCFGVGLCLTVRDVRVLRDQLLAHDDWEVAGHAYATEHDRYFGVIHQGTEWFAQIFYDQGPQAEARRAKAFPLIAHDESRVPDYIFSGPEVAVDERVRRRFFGEE